jgi:hypothetical protein
MPAGDADDDGDADEAGDGVDTATGDEPPQATATVKTVSTRATRAISRRLPTWA